MNGVEIKIDNLGRLVIPIKYRKKFSIDNGDKLLISSNDSSIIISTVTKRCALCKTKLKGDEGIELCKSCISKVQSLQDISSHKAN